MRRLFEDIPLTEMNTSMTINATAMWLLALYQVVAEEQAGEGADVEEVHGRLAGTTQNDIIKEYLSRGTYVFPPEHSLRLTSDLISYTVNHIPKWNPINICSYHLQEAGATPTQELAYSLCTAIAVLDTVRESGQVAPEDFAKVVGRISFFVNAGVRFVEETCKMRAFVQLWDEITRERYGVEDEKMRRACPDPGTSSGRSGCSRCWPSSPTSWSTTTSSRAPPSSRPRWRSWSPAPVRRWTASRRWGERSRPSSPAT
jgi:(2R)-ethylmalonyl-CoA mutase